MSKRPVTTNAPTPTETAPVVSRRGLMRGAALVGAAGVAVAVTPGAAAAAAAPSAPTMPRTPATGALHAEPLVVHLRDARTGELDVFTGEEHHRVVDHRLAQAIVHALG